MPIKKFRSIEEMDAARADLWCDQIGPALFRRIARLWERSSRLSPRKFPKGVIKYRNLEEAQADRERWQKEHVQRVQRERLENGTVQVIQAGRFGSLKSE